jgi:hypothetical protein
MIRHIGPVVDTESEALAWAAAKCREIVATRPPAIVTVGVRAKD